MSKTTRLKPIVIKRNHLSPAVQRIIGSAFASDAFINIARFMAWDSAGLALSRGLLKASVPSYYAFVKPTGFSASIRGARQSRALSESWLLSGALSSLISGDYSSVTNTPFIAAARLMNRIEAVRIVQFLHEHLSSQIRASKSIVSPQYLSHYSNEQASVAMLTRTHPIFRVSLRGDIVFLPVSRREYIQYRFQQSKFAKLGINPWKWRGYLEPPKATASWRREAAQKVREWSERIRERWTPTPVPRPALVRVHSKTPKRENGVRYTLRRKR